MLSMVLKKTDLGQAEMRVKTPLLDRRERRALILMDGSRNLIQVQELIGASVEGIANRLIRLGLVASREVSVSHLKIRRAIEFTDPVVGKTPATNFESFDQYLPTHSTHWKSGGYDQPADAEIQITAVPAVQSEPPVSTVAGLLEALKSGQNNAQQELRPRGILLGKMYLMDQVERLLGKDDVILRDKLQQVRSEEQLLTVCEEVLELIQGVVSQDMLVAIEKRFFECISRR
jgi:hypothetical protein